MSPPSGAGAEAEHLRTKARKDLLNLLEGVRKAKTTTVGVSYLEHLSRLEERKTWSLAKP
jgi:hypothetical protein